MEMLTQAMAMLTQAIAMLNQAMAMLNLNFCHLFSLQRLTGGLSRYKVALQICKGIKLLYIV